MTCVVGGFDCTDLLDSVGRPAIVLPDHNGVRGEMATQFVDKSMIEDSHPIPAQPI